MSWAKIQSQASGCDEQWNNEACHGQFGKRACYSCGGRIEYLMNKGMDETAARKKIADEFILVCGKCGPNGGYGDITIQSEGYELVWQDDFDGDALNGTNWMHIEGGWGWGNNEKQYYTNRADNSFVSDGTLKIKAVREYYGGNRYTSAKLQTHAPFWLYGKFSVRARILGTAKGTWAAIWMMPGVNLYGKWPKSGEIDIMEHVGCDVGDVHGTVHTGAYNHIKNTQVGGSTQLDVTQWHTYTAEWRPDFVIFAVDDKVYSAFPRKSDDPDEWPFNHEFYLILNMAVGGNWGGYCGIDERAFRGDGQVMEVDWARVEDRPIIM